MKEMKWITKGQAANVVIVQLIDPMVEVMAGTGWTMVR